MGSLLARSEMEGRVSRLRARMAERPAGPHTSDFTRSFHPVADWRLEAGMVFHMYASAKGLSLSETVLVTQEGPRRLTQTPRTLFET